MLLYGRLRVWKNECIVNVLVCFFRKNDGYVWLYLFKVRFIWSLSWVIDMDGW